MSRMLRVYVFGPISAKNAHDVLFNIGEAIDFGADLFSIGVSPFVPHLNYHFSFKSKHSNDAYYGADDVWLDVSDVLVAATPRWSRSKGAKAEVARAKQLGIPIYFTRSGFISALRAGRIKPRELVEKGKEG